MPHYVCAFLSGSSLLAKETIHWLPVYKGLNTSIGKIRYINDIKILNIKSVYGERCQNLMLIRTCIKKQVHMITNYNNHVL